MGSVDRIASPARNRALRLLAGLLMGAALGFLIGADTASAASCSGTIGPVLNERGREVPTFSFRCDVPIGGNYPGRLFQVEFSNRDATTVKEPMLGKLWLEDFVGQCDPVSPEGADGMKSYVECTALSDAADSVTVPAGTTITGTPWDADKDMPVCSVAADVTVYGWAEAVLASFPLRSTCTANWTVRNALAVTVSGNGTVSGDVDGISCGGGTCTYRYPVGTRVSLSVTPDRGARFAGWTGDCTGTATRCSLVLEDDLALGAKFAGGRPTPPASKQRLSVDRAATLSGTTVSTVLGCQGPKRKSCTVLAALTSTEHLQGTSAIAVRNSSARTRVVTVARRTVTIPAGTQRTISLSVNATGKEMLRRFHTLPARLTVSLTKHRQPDRDPLESGHLQTTAAPLVSCAVNSLKKS
jgi:Divergent InlB B-repeat domain